MVRTSPTGQKYLEVQEAEKLEADINEMLKKLGLDARVHYHPYWLEVPFMDLAARKLRVNLLERTREAAKES